MNRSAREPMWLSETAEAACGGDELAREFVDVFRFLNQYEPRPDYWAALLWKRMMGPVVLDPGTPKDQAVRIYAHCSPGKSGSITVLALNTDTTSAQTLTISAAGERYTLTSPELTSTTVMLNGVELKAGHDGSVPALHGERFAAGSLRLAPASITFLTVSPAENLNCGK